MLWYDESIYEKSAYFSPGKFGNSQVPWTHKQYIEIETYIN